MADTFSCPQCGILLRRSPALTPGVMVKCPKCAHQFRVPEDAPALPSLELDDTPEEPVRPRAQPPRLDRPFAFEDTGGSPAPRPPERGRPEPERPRRERSIDEDEDDRPGRRRDRDFDVEDDRPRRRRDRDSDDDDRPRRQSRLETLPLGNSLEIGASFEQAKSCWGEYVGPAIGFAFLAAFIMIPVALLTIIPVFGHIVYLVVISSLMRGPQIVALRVVQGKEWTFNDFFTGFNYFGNFLGLAFFQGLLSFVASLPAIIMLIVSTVMFASGPSVNNFLLTRVMMLLGVAVAIPLYLYLDARFFTFAPQLIIQKRLNVIEAMQGCWRLSEGRTLSFVGLNLLFVLTAMSGIIVCLGTLFTVPLAHLFVASAYARIMNLPTAEDAPRRSARRYEDDENDRPRRSARREEEDDDDRPRPRRSRPVDDY